VLCTDGQWRQIVTVQDAKDSGCDLFDIEQLRQEYTEEEFNQLLMCQFMDDANSVFGFDELLDCGVDSLVAWRDFARSQERPIGSREVWVGYDPSRTRDNAAVVVVAPPAANGGFFRVLEKHEWRGIDFVQQAEAIKRITKRYNVTYMGIDTTGVGYGVFDMVRSFFPAAQSINYNPTVKSRLVLRAKELVRSRRLQWDSGWHDLMRSLLAIRRVQTSSGNAITYEADRNEQTGHADLAWALMHALDKQPLNSIVPGMEQRLAFMQVS
jgi:phage terminase large subunit-like protein